MSASELSAHARENGVLVSALGPKYARLVTHLDISEAQAKSAAEVLASILKGK
jgi:threonine aldolase